MGVKKANAIRAHLTGHKLAALVQRRVSPPPKPYWAERSYTVGRVQEWPTGDGQAAARWMDDLQWLPFPGYDWDSPLQQVCHVLRERRLQNQPSPGDGMGQLYLSGVEGGPVDGIALLTIEGVPQ